MGYFKWTIFLALSVVLYVEAGDLMRKSIIFDKKTPGVFYCPQHKPSSIDKMIVRARPLKKLCEFDGKRPFPNNYKSDCFHDIDETDYACKEKYRIMMRLHPPSQEDKESEKWERAYSKFNRKKQSARKNKN